MDGRNCCFTHVCRWQKNDRLMFLHEPSAADGNSRHHCVNFTVLTKLLCLFRNPGGIRFGSSEIYDVLDLSFKQEIVDYCAVGQLIDDGADERVLLFVKLPEGQAITPEFEAKIKKEMRARRSPRHAPAKVCPFLL